jgi:cupin 2 domain-containing protein
MIHTNCFNIYKKVEPPREGELFETLLKKRNVTIKRIVSSENIDYEMMVQEEDEWFIMIEGEAVIMIDGEQKDLMRGDYCFIAANTPHQLSSVKRGTIWLAIHIR